MTYAGAAAGRSRFPDRIDLDIPNVARMYDYYLGGAHNFAADRELAEKAIEVRPEVITNARATRDFLRRVVNYALTRGIRQFLDLGTGIPSRGHVHEIAHRQHPETKVSYVDHDPVAVAHAVAILRGVDNTTVTLADLRDVDDVLERATKNLDLTQPVAVLATSVLHFVLDTEAAAEAVARYSEAIAPDSLFALSHSTAIEIPDEAEAIANLYKATATPITMRSPEVLRSWLTEAHLEPILPGIVDVTRWRPDTHPLPELSSVFGGVGLRR
ncbi:SAM-dependent methyltransferase [Actinoalloteichus hymeniacidonis]|uniref:S-adenosyl methyltransferase n=1 Tax=Actinoalloteichus hymeniacidonis TaxID=340345 RepID=A0AAC9MYL4_9PSEU|nr:SAM-dependent methyltransferase [Actinoalloteichus hymeniacidonis]AOS63420.1 S-adenosyl methyltransferase [Actinoalloteichus hymeniacidonis]MBB5908538.1 trans-aconitate methyltransferase [Actinoalloteichus hymeniacidonis]